MERCEIKSRIIALVEYDQACQRMDIEFRSGETRSLLDVPRETFMKLVKAPSPGMYYVENIRGRYERLVVA